MRKWRCSCSLALLVLIVGCNATPRTHEESKQLAQKRFNHQKAKAKFLLAMEQFDSGQIKKARESAEGAIALYPDDSDYFLLLAKIYLEEGDLARAGQALASKAPPGGPSAEFHYVTGMIAQRAGRSAEALESYRRAHELDPLNADYVMACGELLITLNRAEEALQLVADRVLDNDASGRLHALRGEALAMLRRFDEAADAYRRAVIESPHDDSLLESLATVLFRAARYADAIPPLRTLHALLKNNAPRHLKRMLAECYLETGDYAAARRHLQELTGMNAVDARAWLLSARCYLALDQLVDAQFAARRAVDLGSGANSAQTVLGLVLYRQENWGDAKRALEAALRANPEEVAALCLLGQVSESTGAPGQALEYYRRARQVDPRDDLARHLYQQLAAVSADDR